MPFNSDVGKEEDALKAALARERKAKDKAADKADKKAREAKDKADAKKARDPGDNYGQSKLDRGRAQDNADVRPRMSPGGLQRVIDRGAQKTRESVGRLLPQPQRGRTASA